MSTSISSVRRLNSSRLRPRLALTCLLASLSMATIPSTVSAATAFKVEQAATKPAEWYSSDEGAQIVANIVSWQNANGGWWKGYDGSVPRPATLGPPTTAGQVPGDDESVWRRTSTIDNGATYTELRVLAKSLSARDTPQVRDAFDKGLKFLLTAQYPTGGWPQRYPLEENYGRFVTFNDDAMVKVMRLMDDIAEGRGEFAFVDDATRRRCHAAFNGGVEFILNAQVKTPLGLTVWCQQHDPVTYAPEGARAYELTSLSGSESAAILSLLMDLPNPDDRVKAAVQAGVRWFQHSAIYGKRIERRPDASKPRGVDAVLVDDPAAGPLWARFYDIESNRPFFCGRDGVKKWSYMEIEPERRSGYAWYRPWGKSLLEKYPRWAAKHGIHPAKAE